MSFCGFLPLCSQRRTLIEGKRCRFFLASWLKGCREVQGKVLGMRFFIFLLRSSSSFALPPFVDLEKKNTSPPPGYSDFVSHFRTASSYIANHRSKTMVVLLPGEVKRGIFEEEREQEEKIERGKRNRRLTKKTPKTQKTQKNRSSPARTSSAASSPTSASSTAWASAWSWPWAPSRRSTGGS